MGKSATYPPCGEATHSDQIPSQNVQTLNSEKPPRRRRKNPRKIRLPTESAQRKKSASALTSFQIQIIFYYFWELEG